MPNTNYNKSLETNKDPSTSPLYSISNKLAHDEFAKRKIEVEITVELITDLEK